MTEEYEFVEPLRKIIAGLGFEQVLTIPLVSRLLRKEQPHPEFLDVWFHNDGILFEIESIGGWRVNDCNLSYNWHVKPEYLLSEAELEKQYGEEAIYEIDLARRGSSSPAYDKHADCWWTVGNKKGSDTRRQLADILRCMHTYGIFRNPWIKYPFSILSHYADEYDQQTGEKIPWEMMKAVERHKATTAQRILLLPEYVRNCIQS